MSELTLGQKRVMAKFNPSEDNLVEIIKNKTAELIDLLESTKPVGSYNVKTNGEKIRAISTAQTHYETACMYAVKSNFINQ